MLIRFIFIESLKLIKNNITVITPSVVVSLMSLIISSLTLGGSVDLSGAKTPEAMFLLLKDIFGTLMMLSVVSYFLQALAHGVTIVMVREAIFGRQISVDRALLFTLMRMDALLVVIIVAGLLMFFGVFLFLIPSILVGYFFMFTFTIVLNEDISGREAMKRSFHMVRGNIFNSLMLFAHLSMLTITVTIVTMAVGEIGKAGVVMSTLVTGTYMSFVAASITRLYIEIRRVELNT
ncbi:MAG: hypothetical protein HQL61_14860 [Magnetococcales bacterium]|nr:hypothetical protein [Nitrospirota bacterium]